MQKNNLMKKALQIIIWLVVIIIVIKVILMLVGLALIIYGTYIGTSVLNDLPVP
nr:MAG TPA: hypothetical protein [Microviridae sp.]